MGLEVGEGLLDRVEIGRTGRQETEFRAGRGVFLALVSGEIVHHDDVAWPERRRQALARVLDEQSAIHGMIDDEERGDSL